MQGKSVCKWKSPYAPSSARWLPRRSGCCARLAHRPMALSPLTIRLFGPLRVTVRGEPLPRVRTRSVEWLLALLTLRHGSAVSRAWLAGTLWPESEENQALQNLRNDLVALRKALGPEAVRIQSP